MHSWTRLNSLLIRLMLYGKRLNSLLIRLRGKQAIILSVKEVAKSFWKQVIISKKWLTEKRDEFKILTLPKML